MVGVIGNRDEGQRQSVGPQRFDDRGGILVGEDAENQVLRPVICQQRSERRRSLKIMGSVNPGFGSPNERSLSEFLETGRPAGGGQTAHERYAANGQFRLLLQHVPGEIGVAYLMSPKE